MSDFKTRLIQERDELQEKYDKLTTFIYTGASKKLSEVDHILLAQQHMHMGNYLVTLNQRLTRL